MEGFRQNPKMKSQIACFKEGGSTTPAKKEAKSHMKSDVAEDKKIVKKAVAQHEGAKHKGEEKTELKLKQGGRAKKDKPSVKRFDSKAIKMKKDASDKKAIAKTKKTKPVVERMSPAPAAPAPEGMGMGMEDTNDMGIEGFAGGGMPGAGLSNMQDIEAYQNAANMGAMGAFMPGAAGAGAMGAGGGMGAANAVGAGAEALSRRRMRPAQMPMLGGASNAVPMPRMAGQGLGRPAPMPMLGGQGNISDQERAILQGLQAVGNYCGGGKA